MKFDELEARFRGLEAQGDARLPPGAWTVARLDGRSFTRLTKIDNDYEKPFDLRFHNAMKATVAGLCDCGFAVRVAFSQSDEISLLFDASERGFGGKTRKWLSVLAGQASAAFSVHQEQIGVFDCRLLSLQNLETVVDYFRWRQSDATRNALSAYCYWGLRAQGLAPRAATQRLNGLTPPQKRAWLDENGVDFAALPLWQTRGFAAHFETYRKTAFNEKTNESIEAERKRLVFDAELPDGEAFADYLHAKIGVVEQ